MITLDSNDLLEAQAFIDQTQPGIYELKDLYGQKWQEIPKPTVFGARFKRAVQAGYLKNIQTTLKPKTNNHQTYELHSN